METLLIFLVMNAGPHRSTTEVFEDHLRLRKDGELEQDLQRNYSDDAVLLCQHGSFRGRDALRKSGEKLAAQLPDGKFEYVFTSIDGQYAFVQWRADSAINRVDHGADSFVIRDGRIVMQSVYYSLTPKT